jgi:hypothetical protein
MRKCRRKGRRIDIKTDRGRGWSTDRRKGRTTYRRKREDRQDI